jgi:catechol 2,3-dioxygenase-like lactoylglutathione lyase family enzyme
MERAGGAVRARPSGSLPSPSGCPYASAAIIAAVRLNHVALTVSDCERSAAFYAEHFGMTERVHDEGHFLLLASEDGSLLALSAGDPPTPLPRMNHFGFQLADADAVRAARERFRAAGAPETEWQEDGNFVRVQVADPDGYRVDVFS